jgi:hypothetical protein
LINWFSSSQTGETMRHSSGEVTARTWRWGPFLILASAFAFFTWRSWRTWPDLLVDFGHELYIPWRIAEGDRLYETIAFTMGPLSQSFNALLFRLFGVSLNTLIAANLVILAGITSLLFAIFRRCGTRATGTAAALFFLAVFAFSQYAKVGNYNYICPYRHEMTHGLALGLLELYCLIRFAENPQRRWLIAAGGCLGLVALTKGEPLLPAVVCGGVALLSGRLASTSGPPERLPETLPHAGPSPWKERLRDGALFMASAAVAPILSLLMFSVTRGWAGAWDATFGWIGYLLDPRLTANSGFYQSLAGWDAPLAQGTTILLAVAGFGLGVVIGCLVETIVGGAAKNWKFALGLGLISAVIAPFGLGYLVPPPQWSQAAAVLPVLLPVVVVATGRKLTRELNRNAPTAAAPGERHGHQGSSWPLYLTSAYALCLLPKMFLNPLWGHYGFVLSMPATLVLVHVTLCSIPAWLRRKHMPGRAFTAVAAGLLTACGLVQWQLWDRACQAKTAVFGQGGDRFYIEPEYDERALPALRTLDFLQRTIRPNETLVVIPEGTTFNYLLRARNPTPYLMFSPWEFDAHGGEAVVEKSLRESPPDYFVMVTMDMSVHGRGNFGEPEFGAGIWNFIQAEYQLVDAHVSFDQSFQSAVFQRRAREPASRESGPAE